MTHDPRLTSALDATPLDSDVYGRRYVIEDVYPTVDSGRHPVKRMVGEPVDVWADIFRDGHEVTVAALRWRREGERGWWTAPMLHVENDRWHGTFVPIELGRHVFAIEAWTSGFATWRRDTLAKQRAGQDVALELQEGRALVAAALPRAGDTAGKLQAALNLFDASRDARPLLAADLAAAMAAVEPRPDLTWSQPFPMMIERARARAGAWYELFPRNETDDPARHGTFDDVVARLPDIAAMGFDVLYFPPIHPIGTTNRKGKNNALIGTPDDPGSPYAIGAAEGGHDAIHPALGTLDDFRRLVAAARGHGLEIALDFATQCSPDHPWIRQHPEWFKWRPDGSMKYAENPPKKYEDITNPDFYCADRVALWQALRDVVLFWAEQGVRIIRVDNPHTKPFPFWEWMIRDVQARFPDLIFLSEAFTRPKVMKALAKLGFSQSYTYFTWRTGKDELSAYMVELMRHPEREYFRPNFFVNTPDILPYHLQGGEPWMFKSRVALAATLAGSYGVFAGFELLEHVPLAPGKEEYLDSDKYEIRPRDWNAPGNIKDYIAMLNGVRRANPALQQTSNFAFALVDSPNVIGFVKESVGRDNVVAAAVALAPGRHDVWLHFGDMRIGPEDARRPVRAVENLVTGEWRLVEWGGVRLAIDADRDPAVLLRCVA
ncbi:alpha-1,4-glucan--maltose-1-phosphate maltosyltransferase [Rhodoplanes elegans]|nr:alpha-1,4-glucan--maltose-1-phosphate maltosyltransferase [Rhodoplanes elegans]MBK5958789.1 alpha-1,4-glucan--maltose-1-phosphate maltosyltransferase [Rhodoplanes elegans]